MRLIDADEYKKDMRGVYGDYWESVLDNQDTVEAIPIEHINRVMAYWKENEYEWNGFWWGALDMLIKGWEKEKEIEG